ncbi:MAG: PaaI family thioesterase [Bacteroidetes bacterium]|nr:MAG: PaaI family thioesterase [Bacteroidota bacterium]
MNILKNPYAGLPGYNCFGCSPSNPAGLKMQFREEGGEVVSEWEPAGNFQGFHDILHGGIQATMMDEISSWYVFARMDTAGVTSRLTVRYRKPVHLSAGTITLRAGLKEQRRNMAIIGVSLRDGNGDLCSEGELEYFLLSPEKAREKMHYPGREGFTAGSEF